MVLPGEDRTLNSHIKAQAQPLSGVCRVQFHRFFYSGSFRITGDFCGTDLRFMKTVCFLQQSEEHLKSFLLSIQACVCVCVHVPVCLCVFESENNPCALCGSCLLFLCKALLSEWFNLFLLVRMKNIQEEGFCLMF